MSLYYLTLLVTRVPGRKYSIVLQTCCINYKKILINKKKIILILKRSLRPYASTLIIYSLRI